MSGVKYEQCMFDTNIYYGRIYLWCIYAPNYFRQSSVTLSKMLHVKLVSKLISYFKYKYNFECRHHNSALTPTPIPNNGYFDVTVLSNGLLHCLLSLTSNSFQNRSVNKFYLVQEKVLESMNTRIKCVILLTSDCGWK